MTFRVWYTYTIYSIFIILSYINTVIIEQKERMAIIRKTTKWVIRNSRDWYKSCLMLTNYKCKNSRKCLTFKSTKGWIQKRQISEFKSCSLVLSFVKITQQHPEDIYKVLKDLKRQKIHVDKHGDFCKLPRRPYNDEVLANKKALKWKGKKYIHYQILKCNKTKV